MYLLYSLGPYHIILFSSCMFIFLLSGIPGCAKSALCNEILKMPGGLGDNRLLHSLEGDRTKGTYSLVAACIGPKHGLQEVHLFLDLLQTECVLTCAIVQFTCAYDNKYNLIILAACSHSSQLYALCSCILLFTVIIE
jgi:hypothetical protein